MVAETLRKRNMPSQIEEAGGIKPNSRNAAADRIQGKVRWECVPCVCCLDLKNKFVIVV